MIRQAIGPALARDLSQPGRPSAVGFPTDQRLRAAGFDHLALEWPPSAMAALDA